MLVMLAGRWRDDLRDALKMEPLERAYRGRESQSFDELTSTELGTVSFAADILLDRFVPFMDDPELSKLLRELCGLLDDQKAERARIRAETSAP
jgi:hypothetical protein